MPDGYQGPAEDEEPALVSLESYAESELDWEDDEGGDVKEEPPVKMEVETLHGGAQREPPIDEDAALPMGIDASILQELAWWPARPCTGPPCVDRGCGALCPHGGIGQTCEVAGVMVTVIRAR